MSGQLLQDVLVAAVVLAAVAYLVWKRLRARRRPTPYCGDCPGCAGGGDAPAEPPLVGIGEPGDRRR